LIPNQRFLLSKGKDSLKLDFFSQRERILRTRPFVSKRRKRFKDPESREQAHKASARPQISTPKPRPSLSTRRKHLKILGKENKQTKHALRIGFINDSLALTWVDSY